MQLDSKRRNQIRKAREFQGLSWSGLGERAGIAGETVKHIEQGDNVHPAKVRRVVEVLGIDPARFFGVVSESNQTLAQEASQ
jgi:transcriptional regulator with XRE-family HTH domain